MTESNQNEPPSILDFLVDCESTPFASLYRSIQTYGDPRLPAEVPDLLSAVRGYLREGLLTARLRPEDGSEPELTDSEWSRIADDYSEWLPTATAREFFLDRSGLWLRLTEAGRRSCRAQEEPPAAPPGKGRSA